MVGRGSMDNRGSVDDWGGVVDSVGHNRGSVGNCVVSHDGGSVHSVVGKRGGVVDGVRDNWGSVCNSVVGHGVVGNRVGDNRSCVDSVGNGVGDSVDGVVGGHDLAVSTVGHGGGTSVGEVGAGGCEGTGVVHGLVGGDSGGGLGQAKQGKAHESLHFCSVGV